MWPNRHVRSLVSRTHLLHRSDGSRDYLSIPFRYCRARRSSAFSLIELMVVMVILGMLATGVALAMKGQSDRARKTKAVTDISTYVGALDGFYAVEGRYPTNDEGLAILAVHSKNAPSGHIKKVAKDPWRNEYHYVTPGSKGPFEIVCYGADRKEGGTEMNADISSNNLEDE